MSILDLLNPVHDIVDMANSLIGKFVTDPSEKLAYQTKVLENTTALQTQAAQLESDRLKAQEAIITAEATSSSWLEKDWRPILMLFFGSCVGWIVVGGGTNIHGTPIPADYVNWVLRIVFAGVGGYVAEPVVRALKGGNGTNGNGH